jgi:hypothetical protein
MPEIESGSGEIIADTALSGEVLSSYIGSLPFEEICLQHLRRMNTEKMLPITATSFGNWWGTDPVEKRQADIDVIAANRQTKQIILGECKWKKSISYKAETEKLIRKGYLLPEYTEQHYYLFVKQPSREEKEYNDTKIVTEDMLFDI